jgi:23S rRNA (adenine2503-C2)-methyltransferase
MTNVPQAQRDALAARQPLRPLRADVVQEGRDGTRKLRFRTLDDRAIESVLIPDDDAERDKLTLCVSSQVGCAMDCGFCATATLGYGRNLSAGEIVEQVYRATKLAGRRPTNLVFMGMGEPLHNLENVTRALALLEHPWGLHFSPRRITVSTAGLVPGIEKLGLLSPAPNLAISLNATTDEVRDRIMPVNRKWPIAKLLEAARRFPLAHGRRVTYEYVLLAGVNDSDADADRLVRLLRGMPCKVNLIPWNPFNKIGNPERVPDAPPATGSAGQSPSAPTRSGPQFERPSAERIRTFQQRLRAANMAVYIRSPRGDDIDAACGQLAARDEAGFVPVSRLERPAEAV